MAEVGGLTFAPSPEALGFDSGRLARLDAYMAGLVESGMVAGTSTLLMRHGQVAALQTFGKAHLHDDAPLSRDAVFRIYSMTKPVTGVAMMMLFEEGRWTLDEPITKHLPEFADLRVFTGLQDGGGFLTESASRPPTMREVMSHTAGFGYGITDMHPVEGAYRAAMVLHATSLTQLAERAATVPLAFQPGTDWFYSIATDLQALVVERLTGARFGDVLRERIFEPLRMVDTGFQARPDNRDRLVGFYSHDGERLRQAETAFGLPLPDFTQPPAFEGGGGGLVSTAADYGRFCQMLLNGGELDGARLLSPIAVELMRTNVIPDAVLARPSPHRLLPFNPAFGFGLDLAVMIEPRRLGLMEGRGTMSWGGGGGTWFWIDPEFDIVFVGLIQRLQDPVSSEFRAKSRTFTYQALTRPDL